MPAPTYAAFLTASTFTALCRFSRVQICHNSLVKECVGEVYTCEEHSGCWGSVGGVVGPEATRQINAPWQVVGHTAATPSLLTTIPEACSHHHLQHTSQSSPTRTYNIQHRPPTPVRPPTHVTDSPHIPPTLVTDFSHTYLRHPLQTNITRTSNTHHRPLTPNTYLQHPPQTSNTHHRPPTRTSNTRHRLLGHLGFISRYLPVTGKK